MNSFSRFGWLNTIPTTFAIGALLFGAAPSRMLASADCQMIDYPIYGHCYTENNTEECEYSYGWCCWCTCTDYDDCVQEGSVDDVNCIDPSADCFVSETVDTPAPVTPTPEPVSVTSAPVTPTPGPATSTCRTENYNTGFCTEENNNADCEYDQGDCCWCDCSDSSCPSMGD
ncbi:unnamed protein product, partial [Ectocarpus sp. 12 AP-2014]